MEPVNRLLSFCQLHSAPCELGQIELSRFEIQGVHKVCVHLKMFITLFVDSAVIE